jgi:hypothetical protein
MEDLRLRASPNPLYNVQVKGSLPYPADEAFSGRNPRYPAPQFSMPPLTAH